MTLKELKDFINKIESEYGGDEITNHINDALEVCVWQHNDKIRDLCASNGVKHITLVKDPDSDIIQILICPYGYHLPDNLDYLLSDDM